MTDIRSRRAALGATTVGERMLRLVEELYPLCRSITGDGVRATLDLVGRTVPLEVHEVPTGTPVLDWVVPKEWNIRDAYVKAPDGHRVIDFNESNLHVVSYSVPVDARLSLDDLRPHLFSLPDRPTLVPYRTSYYNETWGFCVSDDTLGALADVEYDVRIDSTLDDGALTYGEVIVPGQSQQEVLLTCHVDHPSLANDNLSGIAVLTALGDLLAGLALRWTYRLLFIPVTIGAITWLARNEDVTARVAHGLVLSGVGDRAPLSYKRSRRGDATIDRVAAHVLGHLDPRHRLLDFHPYGYDERQFCSPGFDLPVGRLSRSIHGEYPEYHTSADDLSFVDAGQLADALEAVLAMIEVLERNRNVVNLSPKGEPQLGRRGLYRAVGGDVDSKATEMAFLWVLNQADGTRSLLDVAERAELPFSVIDSAAVLLEEHGLVETRVD